MGVQGAKRCSTPTSKTCCPRYQKRKLIFCWWGYAVAAHGHPRATGDPDLWVRPDIDLCVIGRADLILNKKASGRPKDLADVESLDPTGA